MVQSMSRIHGTLSTGSMHARSSAASHARPVRSSMRFIARRTTSSLTARVMPSSGGWRVSPRTELMWA